MVDCGGELVRCGGELRRVLPVVSQWVASFFLFFDVISSMGLC